QQNAIRVIADTETNTVFVQAAPADLADIKALIDLLDSTQAVATNDLRVVHLRNTQADEMATVLMQAITAGIAPFAPTASQVAPVPGGRLGGGPGAAGALPAAQFGQLPGQFGAVPGAPGAAAATNVPRGTVTKTTALRFLARTGAVESGLLEDVHITPDIR